MRPAPLRLAAAAVLATISLVSVESQPALRSITLRVGAAAFWNGAYVQDAATDLPGDEACAVEQCFEYPIRVAPGGSLLRVAIDTPDRSNQFELDLIDAAGVQQASGANALQSHRHIAADPCG